MTEMKCFVSNRNDIYSFECVMYVAAETKDAMG